MSHLQETFDEMENGYMFDFLGPGDLKNKVIVIKNPTLNDPRPKRSPPYDVFTTENRKIMELTVPKWSTSIVSTVSIFEPVINTTKIPVPVCKPEISTCTSTKNTQKTSTLEIKHTKTKSHVLPTSSLEMKVPTNSNNMNHTPIKTNRNQFKSKRRRFEQRYGPKKKKHVESHTEPKLNMLM